MVSPLTTMKFPSLSSKKVALLCTFLESSVMAYSFAALTLSVL